MDLTCPKCQGSMRSYERNGVTVDQCTECRGIFLDRGELDRLVDAEAGYHDGPQQPSGPGASTGSGGAGAGGLGGLVGEVLQQAKAAKGGSHGQQQHYGGKRKKSLIGELFG